MTGDVKTVHAVITGRVQGVWYRAWTAGEAKKLGLDGWVRNLRDGSVEAVFSGPGANVDEILKRCRKGPPLARVDDIRVKPWEETPRPGFEKRPTF